MELARAINSITILSHCVCLTAANLSNYLNNPQTSIVSNALYFD